MKYANYIHACVQTLLVGKRHRVVHEADAQSRLCHAAISRVQNSAIFSHFANQNVSAHALSAIYIFHGKGLFDRSLTLPQKFNQSYFVIIFVQESHTLCTISVELQSQSI